MEAIKKATDGTFDDDYITSQCPVCQRQMQEYEILSTVPFTEIYKKNNEYHQS